MALTTEQMMDWIGKASYQELLRHWRYASVGDPYFVGEVAEHYRAIMAKKRSEVGPSEAVRISKALG